MKIGLAQNRGAIQTALADHLAANTTLINVDSTGFDTAELLAIQSERERQARAQATVDHRIQSALMARSSPREIGGKSWTDVLATRMRISRKEASRRVAAAADLGPRYGLTGEVLEPTLPACAEALRSATINTEHPDTKAADVEAQSEPEPAATDASPDQHKQREAARRDTRTQAQRNPDALKAALRELLMSKRLGRHSGLPVTRRRLHHPVIPLFGTGTTARGDPEPRPAQPRRQPGSAGSPASPGPARH